MDEVQLTKQNQVLRLVWRITYLCLFRYSPRPFFFWRRYLLNLFGARLASGVKIYPSVIVWAPWNLTMQRNSTLGPNVNCYSVGKIEIGKFSSVSQGAFLCTASHRYQCLHDSCDGSMPLLIGSITIKDRVWVAAEAFVGPKVVLHAGVVVLARAVVTRSVPGGDVVAGNPARKVSTVARLDNLETET